MTKIYAIQFRYEGNVTGECGIVPMNVRAESAKEAVRVLIESLKEQGYKVTEVYNVFQLMKKPKGGWLANVQKEKEDGLGIHSR